jgi:hypothetical protein
MRTAPDVVAELEMRANRGSAVLWAFRYWPEPATRKSKTGQ